MPGTRVSPQHSRGLIAALRFMHAGRLTEALAVAEKETASSPVCTPAHALVATLLVQLGRPQEAENVIQQALGLGTGTADAYDGLAHALMLLGKHDRSNSLYRRAVELAPWDAGLWYNLASSERSLGNLSQAKAALDQSISLNANQYPSHLLRSELCVQTPDSNHVFQLQSLLRDPTLPENGKVFLGYALGKELDDLHLYDEAFEWFSYAANARRRQMSYEVSADERKLARIREVFSEEILHTTIDPSLSERYIFIVGLPRSGTTLLERILTNLPGVRSNGETEYFSHSLISASPLEGADIFARAAVANPQRIAELYSGLAPTSDGEYVIEKLPMNYLYLGAIHRALPGAKLLHVSRAPVATCFAMYRTLFRAAYPFSYDFQELARYYAAYSELMRHWYASIGSSIQEVRYEDLVKQPRNVGAAVAQFCGLPWTDAATAIEHNRSVSLTASATQVRRAIYTTSLDRVRHYRRHLEPLVDALHNAGLQDTE